MTQYSQELIDECIKCFKEEDGIEMTREEANECLNSFTDLYLAFATPETPTK